MTLPQLLSDMALTWPVLLVLGLLGAGVLGVVWRNARRGREKFILIDGSNVMYWRDNTPRIDTVRAVVADLRARGYTPGVVFDANAGYKLEGRYRNHYTLAKRLGLPHEQVLVVPKGEPADPMILRAARDFGGRVVSQDRFRDWEGEFPELRRAGFRVPGGFDGGKLWLDLADNVKAAVRSEERTA